MYRAKLGRRSAVAESVLEAVTIDGPVASGKTTVGRAVAHQLGYRFVDTGIMYRAATWAAGRYGVALSDHDELTDLARSIRIRLVTTGLDSRLFVDGIDATDELRTSQIDRRVSEVSAVSGVRRALVPPQRSIAEAGPVVMVGRDIGTVVLPDARTKVFLDASVEVRAARRFAELVEKGVAADRLSIIEETRRRDRIDSERADSPLRPAHDARIIHTDDLTTEQVVGRIVKLVEER